MPTSNAEELGLFLKCTVIGRGVFGPCTCCTRGGLPQCMLGYHTPPGVDTPPPRETATAADGTHPTGMHSCKSEISNFEESPQMPTLITTVKDKS